MLSRTAIAKALTPKPSPQTTPTIHQLPTITVLWLSVGDVDAGPLDDQVFTAQGRSNLDEGKTHR